MFSTCMITTQKNSKKILENFWGIIIFAATIKYCYYGREK